MLRIVMMGTGEFALPAFRALAASPHPIVGLFTQPDRTGRGHHQHPHPMKEFALEQGIPVFQPERVKRPEALDDLRQLNADLCVVAAYGQILSAELLAIPRLGAINIHASLLPKYRGAAPIQYAIRNGETETGITIFQIEPQLDSGLILSQMTTPIGPDETSGELHDRLALLSADLIVDTVTQIDQGTVTPRPQVGPVTLAPRLQKHEGVIDWSRPAADIANHVRAMQPWPKAFSWLALEDRPSLRVLILKAVRGAAAATQPPGTITAVSPERIEVACGSGTLEVMELQPEGKRPQAVREFLNGHSVVVGNRFVTL